MTKIILKDNLSDYHDLIQYPDGQKSIKLHLDKLNVKEFISIHCRIKNFSELEVLLCLVSALRKYDYSISHIEFVYLFGMRSDRAFNLGEPNYFINIVAPIINSLNTKVYIFFAHNDISLVAINNYLTCNDLNGFIRNINISDVLIGGDRSFGDKHEIMAFDKKRTSSGIHVELKQEDIELLSSDKVESIIICDDLCDGGGTFIAGAEYLKKLFPDKKISLFIVHALFTNGVDIVAKHFDKIICTNSYQDICHPKVEVIDVFGEKNND